MNSEQARPNADRTDEAELAAQAAESILGPNPFVGLSKEDLLKAMSTLVSHAAKDPKTLIRRQAKLVQELGQALVGVSNRAPAKGDKRFKNETWSGNPIYRAGMQAYLAWVDALNAVVDDLDMTRKNKDRSRFLVSLVTDMFAPTNTLLGNPEALHKLAETKGKSALAGIRHLIEDMRNNGGMPSQVDKSGFQLGENIACTPGTVVFRNDIVELIQYQPSTEQVRSVPVLFIPPQINKYYVFDLSPDKSLIKAVVDGGFQTFALSWRNPTPAQRDWGFADYVDAIVSASDAIAAITRSKKVNMLGACAGGITTSIAAAHLAAQRDERLNTLTLMVAVLDMATVEDTTMGLFISEQTLAMAKASSRQKGVLDGADLGRVFAWLRPNDLIWSYWVNNYLLGKEPPAFDILYWNNDATSLPAALHGEFLDLYESNPLAAHGKLEVAGSEIDLADVTADVFLVGGISDHITPWKATYRSCRLFGGKVEYVLTNSGHVQSILNPPGNPKANYFTCNGVPDDPDQYLEQATKNQGSWWTHWLAWLHERSGRNKKAPARLGNKRFPPIEDAPGSYIHES